MLISGTDRLAGWSLWFFVYAILHAAHVGAGAFAFMLEATMAGLIAYVVARQIPTDDDGRRLPPMASAFIITLGFVILGSAMLGGALARRASHRG